MNATWKLALIATAASAAVGSYAIPAEAQTVPPGGSPSPPNSSQVQEVVVTARKRAEDVSKVPESVTAVTAATIERAGITSVEGLNSVVPSFIQLPAQDPGTNFIAVRGITQVRLADPPVALVIDGVQSPSPDEGTQDLYNIQQIEVLQGPQGAIYGRNAIGGAINIVTKAPTNTFQNEVSGEAAEGDFYRVFGTSSGPIVPDKLLYTLSAEYKTNSGQIKDATTGQEVDNFSGYNLRGRLLYNATDRLKMDFRATTDYLRGGSAYYYDVFPGQSVQDTQDVIANRKGLGLRRIEGYSVKADYDLSSVTLTSITAYSRARAATLGQDLDFFPYPATSYFTGLTLSQSRDTKAWSEEFRIVSNSKGPLRWLVGAYYLNTHFDFHTTTYVDLGPGTQADAGPVYTYFPQSNRNNAYAVFGNFDYDLTRKIELSLGVRQDWDDRHQLNPANGSTVNATFQAIQPKVSATYFFQPDRMIYASIGQGFRSGGFNVQSAFLPREYPAQTAQTYEIGLKDDWFDRRLHTDLAIFYTEQDHTPDFRFDATTGAQGVLTINKAHHEGFQGDFQLQLLPGLQLTGGGSVIVSRIDDYDGTGLYVGNKLPHVNGWSYNFGLQYVRTLPRDIDMQARVDYNAYGDLYWEVDNANELKSADLVNARLSFTLRAWTLTLYAQNLFDNRFPLDLDSPEFIGSFTTIGYPNEPRRAGAKIGYRF